MDLISSLAVITLAALIHASFQLSVSVLLLLSGHSLGSRHSHLRLMRLTTSFVIGAGTMTALLLTFVSFVLQNLFGSDAPQIVWAMACGIMFGVAVSVWLFYYRHEKGTTTWLPRNIADYLSHRTKATKLSGEAFGLGLTSVIGELLFILAPIAASALALIQLPGAWKLVGVAIYVIISMLSLILVWVLIGGGRKIADVQRWRETNKNFLQLSAGAGLLILGIFMYTTQIAGLNLVIK